MIPPRNCRRCPRLAGYRSDLQRCHPTYHNQPVPAFGESRSRLLIVGLAPGRHGANATGRPFTGDASGSLLFKALKQFGFSSHARSVSSADGVELFDCRITNAVKCVPPKNRPIAEEINACNEFLRREICEMGDGGLILALGTIAHKAILKAIGCKQSAHRFGFGAVHHLPGNIEVVDSFHPSRYMIQTGKLTEDMFFGIFAFVRRRLG